MTITSTSTSVSSSVLLVQHQRRRSAVVVRSSARFAKTTNITDTNNAETTSSSSSSSSSSSDYDEENTNMNEKKNENKNNRRQAIVGLSSLAIALGLQTTSQSSFAAEEEEKKKKVVAVKFTPYVVQSESSEEMIEVAKQLKEAGARLYGAFWCENCNKQKETLGKQAMAMIEYVECFPEGVYQNSPDGRADVTKPADFCGPYSEAWPMWVLPSPGTPDTPEIGVQGKILKEKELKKLINEASGKKVDLVKYFTTLEVK